MDISPLLSTLGTIPARLAQAALVIILGLIVLRITRVFVNRLEKRIVESKVDLQQQARLKTLLSAGNYVVTFLVIFIDALMILIVLGIDITPVLASVGILGLAVSLGAQSIIKDYVGGVVILIEDQFRVGDAVTILGNAGIVEEVGLRATRIRDLEGRLIIISNGDIRIVSRAGYDWARAVVDLNVAYSADIGTLVKVLDGAMQKAKEDPDVAVYLLDNPEIQGWNSFTPWAVQVRLIAKTQPDRRVEVAAQLRRYAQQALREAGLYVATPTLDSQPGVGSPQ